MAAQVYPTKRRLAFGKNSLLTWSVIGFFVVLWAPLWFVDFVDAQTPTLAFYGLMLCFSLLGPMLQMVARWFYFSPTLTMHQAFSFEWLFSGIHALNPALSSGAFEKAFLRREAGVFTDLQTGWNRIQKGVDGIAPWVGIIILMGIGRWGGLAATVVFGALLAIALQLHALRKQSIYPYRIQKIVEIAVWAHPLRLLFFAGACQVIYPDAPLWQGYMLGLLLTLLAELSPIPLALGLLEIGYLVLTAIGGNFAVGALSILVFRIGYYAPPIVGCLFYLPRHKMTLLDIYHPELLSWLKNVRPLPVAAQHTQLTGVHLSIIIPAYNEQNRLPNYLSKVFDYCSKQPWSSEIIIVDDGSQDDTSNYVRLFIQQHSAVRLIQHHTNRGKGAALRTGMERAVGRYVLFTDADGSTPITEADKLLNAMQPKVDIVIATRVAGSQVYRLFFLRLILGRMFYRLTSLLAVPGISDTQCGFKIVRRRRLQGLFEITQEDGWVFDVELLFLAQKMGLHIAEVPVRWTEQAGSKLSLLVDGPQMLQALLRIRRHWSGIWIDPQPLHRARLTDLLARARMRSVQQAVAFESRLHTLGPVSAQVLSDTNAHHDVYQHIYRRCTVGKLPP